MIHIPPSIADKCRNSIFGIGTAQAAYANTIANNIKPLSRGKTTRYRHISYTAQRDPVNSCLCEIGAVVAAAAFSTEIKKKPNTNCQLIENKFASHFLYVLRCFASNKIQN